MHAQTEIIKDIKEKCAAKIGEIWQKKEETIQEKFDRSMAAIRAAIEDARLDGLEEALKGKLEEALVTEIAERAKDFCASEINRICDTEDLAIEWKFDETRQIVAEIGKCGFPDRMRAIIMTQLDIMRVNVWLLKEDKRIKKAIEQAPASEICISPDLSMFA